MPPAPPGDRPMKIAVDAMGGDGGVPVNVEGAIAAAREYGLDVVLVGDQTIIERELARHRVGKLPITVRHASQVVEMGEQPSHALRYHGQRYDCGSRLGFLEANVAVALNRADIAGETRALLGRLLKG